MGRIKRGVKTGRKWMAEILPGERKVAVRMNNYMPEDLTGKSAFTILGEKRGKIRRADREEAVLLNGERIQRAAWPLYIVFDFKYRSGEAVVATSDVPDYHISRQKKYKIRGIYHFTVTAGAAGEDEQKLRVKCDDGMIRIINVDYFEKIPTERDLSFLPYAASPPSLPYRGR